MQFGVCCGPDLAPAAAAAGYDYFEWTVGDFLRPAAGEDEFHEGLARVRAAPLPCPVLNCFIPAGLKIAGPRADPAKLEAYAATALRRAEAAGVRVIVFGSGGARGVPEGFDRQRALAQIEDFCRYTAARAGEHGVTVAIEPLNPKECNTLTTVDEAAALARGINHPALRILVDTYHWAAGDGSVRGIAANGDLLAHVHAATFPGRLAPGAEHCDLEPCFDALRTTGYDGRISLECALKEPGAELPRALAVMKALLRVSSPPF